MGGQLLALRVRLGSQQVLSAGQLTAWGWRVPFAVGVAALLVVSAYPSSLAIVKAELLPAHVRAIGVGLPYGA